MKTTGKVIIAIVAVVVIIAVAIFSSYNGLVGLDENVNAAYSNIKVQLQRRSDLIPNLVSTVQGYATHEEEVFTAVADARAKLAGARSVDETIEADGELSSALSRLLAISEAYPQLQANENFLSLQDELAGTENRISVARKDYNDAAQIYNKKVRSFPTVIFAGMFGFDRKPLYESQPGAEQVPTVNFN